MFRVNEVEECGPIYGLAVQVKVWLWSMVLSTRKRSWPDVSLAVGIKLWCYPMARA
jgi:hypothetical protein